MKKITISHGGKVTLFDGPFAKTTNIIYTDPDGTDDLPKEEYLVEPDEKTWKKWMEKPPRLRELQASKIFKNSIKSKL